MRADRLLHAIVQRQLAAPALERRLRLAMVGRCGEQVFVGAHREQRIAHAVLNLSEQETRLVQLRVESDRALALVARLLVTALECGRHGGAEVQPGVSGIGGDRLAKAVGGGARLAGLERRPRRALDERGARIDLRGRRGGARGQQQHRQQREHAGATHENVTKMLEPRPRLSSGRRPIHLSFPHCLMLSLRAIRMVQPASAAIEEGVIDVLKNVSRRPIEPTLDSDLVADLGFDSLQVLEVIAELEDRFDISIPLNDVPATRTVAQVVAQVARLVGDRPTP